MPAAPEKAGPARLTHLRPLGTGALSSAGPVALALAGWAFCFIGNWRGTDWAAEVYRSHQAAHWGFAIWDPGWYGGTYPLNYSLVYPLAAGYLGLWLVAAGSVAGAAYCFDRLVVREFGKRPAGSWYFAAATVVEVAIGQLPTLAAEALALGSVLCLANCRRASATPPRAGAVRLDHVNRSLLAFQLAGGLLLGALAAFTSPVVGAFLAMVLLAWGLADIGRVGRSVVTVELLAGGLVFVSTAALPLVFPGPGYFPFGVGDLVVVLAICGLLASPLVRAARQVRATAVLYGAVSTGLFAFRTQMGDNDIRLAAYIGVPLLICYLPRVLERLAGYGATTRTAATDGDADRDTGLRSSAARAVPVPGAIAYCGLLLVLVAWHWTPIVEAFDGDANGPSSTAAYYQPLIAELTRLSGGQPVRVEIPPTVHHWESAYVAPVYPLARGWERQLDMAYNGLFYTGGPLPATAYRSWLLSNGVSYVALDDAPLDYAATSEAALLRSGQVNGLQPVWRNAHWRLWQVVGSPGLASGPARILSLTPRSVRIQVSGPGQSELRLRWSPYWSIAPSPGVQASRVPSSGMQASAVQACVSRGPGGWTDLSSDATGELGLSLSVAHANHGHCPPAGSVRS